MKRTKIQRIISLILIVVLFLPYGLCLSRVYGDSKTDLQNANDEKKDLESKYEEAQRTLKELKEKSDDVQTYITELDAQSAELDASLDALNTQVIELESEIEDTQVKLDEAQVQAEEQYATMKLRIQYMYEHNNESYLTLLIQSRSMAELLNRAEYITKISEYDRSMLEKYQETVTFIAYAKQKLEDDRAQLVEKQADLEDQKSAVQFLASAKTEELNSLGELTKQQETYNKKLEADKKAQEEYIAQLEAKIREEEKQGSSINAYDGGQFKWPTVSTRITSDYGDKDGRPAPHKGIDIGAQKIGAAGDPIYAAYDGKVVISTYSSSAGNYIMIYHGNGLYTRYLHCSSLLVKADDYVTKGQKIALMGTTGDSSGVHLHFDVRLNGNYVSPWNYLGR